MEHPPVKPLDRLHQRLDEQMAVLGKIQQSIATVEARCGPCQNTVERHERMLNGGNGDGLVARVLANETQLEAHGKIISDGGDRLGVKSLLAIMAAVGALAGTIAAAMGTIVSKG